MDKSARGILEIQRLIVEHAGTHEGIALMVVAIVEKQITPWQKDPRVHEHGPQAGSRSEPGPGARSKRFGPRAESTNRVHKFSVQEVGDTELESEMKARLQAL